jgi:hypothetical protein
MAFDHSENDESQARRAGGRLLGAATTTQERSASQIQDPDAINARTATARTAGRTQVGGVVQAAPTTVGPATGYGAASVNTAQSDQQRAYQEALQQHLQGVVAGTEGPSAAQLQQAQGNRAAMSSQLAMVGGNKGYSGASQRQALRNVSALQQQNNAQTSVLRAQEQVQARGELANLTGQIRTQDIGTATTNAGLQQQARQEYAAAQNRMTELQAQIRQQGGQFNAAQANEVTKLQAQLDAQRAQANATQGTDVSKFNAGQQNEVARANMEAQLRTNLANLDAQLKSRGMDDEQRRAYLQAYVQTQGQVLHNDLERDVANYNSQLHGKDWLGAGTGALGAGVAIIGGLGAMGGGKKETDDGEEDYTDFVNGIPQDSTGGTAGGTGSTGDVGPINPGNGMGSGNLEVSDRRAKTDVHRESDRDEDEFLQALNAYSYRYRNPADGSGRRSGPMAQDLERSKIGRDLVQTGPDGMKRVDTDGLVMAMAGLLGRVAKEGRLARGAT